MKKVGLKVLELLQTDPDGWKFDQHYAYYGNLAIWTANATYADLTISDARIGTWWQRRKIREAMAVIKFERATKIVENAEIGRTLDRIAKA